MNFLRKLNEGDTIGVFSASSPATFTYAEEYENSKIYFQNKGFHICEGKLTGKYDHYRSGSIKERVEEFNSLVQNKNINCIMSSCGGWVSNSILPYIDYKSLLNNPKIVIGFSDITAILLGIYAMTGITTFYGLDFLSFGNVGLSDLRYEYFKNMFLDIPKIPYSCLLPSLQSDKWITARKGKSRGRLIGGNLNTITGIWGSKYMPEIREGDILFIEDTDKTASIVERSFSFLKLNNVFDKISGIILGKHNAFNDEGCGKMPHDILLEVLGDTDIPVLSEFDCSHTCPSIILPIGVQVELDATDKKVLICDKCLY